MGNQAVNVLASLTIVAGITALMLPGRNTAGVFREFFSGFGGDLRAAEGIQ